MLRQEAQIPAGYNQTTALGIEAQMWLNAQAAYNMQKAEANPDFMERLRHIRHVAAFL